MIQKIIFLSLLVSFVLAEVNPCGNRDGAHFAKNPRGCSWYFVCDDQNQVVRENRCDSIYFFNYDKQACDYRDRVFCDLDDRLRNLTCPDKNGINIIPHPQTCLKYTICFEGVQNDRTCPNGLHFSYFDNKCTDPFYADCNLDYNMCRESIETGLPTFVSNPRDCSSYFICVRETAVIVNCPAGLHFAPDKKMCVEIEDAKCTSELPEDTPRIPDRVFIDCEYKEGAIPHPESCEFYFFCAENRSFLQICGEGLVFDVNTRRCESADKAQCVLDIITTPTSTTTEEGSAEGELLIGFEEIQADKLLEDHEVVDKDNYSPEEEGFIPVY